MTLELKNIGMIKEANVKIDGLTVIAGENDTGKSTVGKVLYGLIKSISWASNTKPKNDNNYKVKFNKEIKYLFDNQFSKDGNINFNYEDTNFKYKIKYNICDSFSLDKEFINNYPNVGRPLLIETPFIWSIYPMLKTVFSFSADRYLEDIDFEIPSALEDLYYALIRKIRKEKSFSLNIKSIIDGEFQKDNFGNFKYNKQGQKIELKNTAMGIKYLGLIQILENHNYLYDGQILILDEPEVHLHPKWQLEMAKIIVKLVKNGVKIVVNSHSPYMIEALELYSSKQKINNNFYLAEKKDEYAIISDVTDNLEPIYSKLAKPIQDLEEESLENFKW